MTVQNTSDFEFETGLEDFDMADAVIPRLSIVHKEGQFKDSLTNEQFSKLSMIILGLVKQRVLWHPDLDEGDWPMCRSADFETGLPNLSDDQPKDKRFPWEKSGFSKSDFPPGDDGKIRLPCKGCTLKEWKSHPDGKKPYCTEQWTLPVLYDPRDSGDWVPAIISFQKTGLKPLKSYFTSFARSKQPAFTAITEVSLDMLKKGSTDYSVPTFKRVGDTDDVNWRDYSINFRTMKDFLTAEPGSRDEDDATPVESRGTTPEDPWETPKESAKKEDIVDADVVETPAEPVKSEPKAETPAPAAAEDDDLPF